MSDFDWVSEVDIPKIEVSDTTIELLRVIDEFKKFPSNLINNRRGRIKLLKQYYNKVSSINYETYNEVFLVDMWLGTLHNLIYCGEYYGNDNCYQKDLRRQITFLKKLGSKVEVDILQDTWYSLAFGDYDDIVNSWVKYKI